MAEFTNPAHNTAGVYQCNQKNWSGGFGKCHPWTPMVGSLGPDKGISCTFYQDDSCGSKSPKHVVGFEYRVYQTWGWSAFAVGKAE
jgi:hypothetical protein